jgi:hypothetical protein
MKLLLISHNNTTWDISHLPLNQWYEVTSEINNCTQDNIRFYSLYNIKIPGGEIGWIPQENFLTVEEWRDKQLQKLI